MKFVVATLCTDCSTCGDENLEFGIREYRCADVATIHDYTLGCSHLALQGYESFANERQGCDRTNMVADLERADFFFHKFAIEIGIRSACGGIELERDVDVGHFSLQALGVDAAVGIEDAIAKSIESD